MNKLFDGAYRVGRLFAFLRFLCRSNRKCALPISITLFVASAAQRREFAVIFTTNQRWARVLESIERRKSSAGTLFGIG